MKTAYSDKLIHKIFIDPDTDPVPIIFKTRIRNTDPMTIYLSLSSVIVYQSDIYLSIFILGVKLNRC